MTTPDPLPPEDQPTAFQLGNPEEDLQDLRRQAQPAAPRRRRRDNRIIRRPETSELGEKVESIALRTAPTFDFFIYSFLSGGVLALGYIFDSQAILFVGIVLAPLLAAWVGTSLAASTGESRFLGQTLGGFLTSLLIVFGIGLLGGFASRIAQPITFSQAYHYARLWIPDLLVLTFGSISLSIAFIQSEEKPILASLMVAYGLFLPASAAGFGLGSGAAGLWPQAGIVLLIHLAISLLLSLLVFFYMGFRPLEQSGYALTGATLLVSLAALIGFLGFAPRLSFTAASTPPPAQATATPLPTYTPLPVKQPTYTLVATHTQSPPTATKPVNTPTHTPSPEITALPTPVYGRIQSIGGDGAAIRAEPGKNAITTVQNGYLVEFLPVDPVTVDGATWVKVLVRTPGRDIEGWVLLTLIVTATPSGSP